ncbi:hypothetical protein [Pseudoalteromonas luteoviolacea]|uniref:Uncharacterized protein n=1 Tax=Pseudoalteromonas luteoviolacea S4054 TaxID=1129367 RepID=A0A0F6A8I7_9GAMM|nr:hypothetical protein [Pseudoalteromonas luteoviolacea]AOT11170.1 hypothetical protein S4054249_25415 [Pseudoalteromonas luteoviolacea]AOT15666.1 hypothetical protein S40542_23095 [Pseudoalteromonas luteoviolacea]AOT20991.1 hypothetical protein S4054_25335 [Pseudoalteromonas luteoviolacea]KKE82438.1 hypothetical protein N479_18365 [Pseudoalteromonas luteoviolacea S4054]KZN67420.1 hypothetical protein N481_02405 [Pseudoalteromonas luteoviolacea S4047-1]
MRYTTLQLHTCLDQSFSSLINRNQPALAQNLIEVVPQNTKGICYEYRSNIKYRPCDILLAYSCAPADLEQLENYVSQLTHDQYASEIIKFIEQRRINPEYRPINLVWFSFDWNSTHYPSIPTFYVSTQSEKYNDKQSLSSLTTDLVTRLVPSHLATAQRVLGCLGKAKLNHIGFTFAREKLKTKFVLTCNTTSILPFMRDLDWEGDHDKLVKLLDFVKDITPKTQISISFDDTLSSKLEIELPWITSHDNNYIDKPFIDFVSDICHAQDEYQSLSELQTWLDAKNHDCIFYNKFSLFEDSTVNLKSYLHSSPFQKRRFLQ